LPLVACLVRLDAVIFVGASVVAVSVTAREKGVPWRDLAVDLARRFGPTALGMALYLGLKLAYYGDVLPNPYYAKAANLWNLRAGLMYLEAFARNSPQLLLLVPAALLAVATSRAEPSRPFTLCCVLAVAGQAVYLLKVGGDFMYYRLAFELYPLLVCAAGLGLRAVVDRHPLAVGTAVVAALALSSTPPVLERAFAMQSIYEMNRYTNEGREVGRRLGSVLPPDTRIATTLAGTIPYYSKLFTVDQWGLNDRFLAHLPANPRVFGRGHVKWAPEEYLVLRGVNLVIDHPVICPCDRLCLTGQPSAFVRLSGNRCLRTRYLVQTKPLTAHLCRRPMAFVLDQVTCPVTRDAAGTSVGERRSRAS